MSRQTPRPDHQFAKPFTAIHDPTLTLIHGHWMDEQEEGNPDALPVEQDLYGLSYRFYRSSILSTHGIIDLHK
ncbi:MAG TPA: hypothetical protein VES92_10320 [Nitrospiraceae bacterium]|nr:hypothetical protein [Nitrospiraceae bacterium]